MWRVIREIGDVSVRENDVRILVEDLNLRLELLGRPCIIVIQKGNQLAGRECDPAIARRRLPAVRLPVILYRSRRDKWREHLLGIVRRTIVDDDDFEVFEGLCKD